MSTCAVVVFGLSFDVHEFVRTLHEKHPYVVISSRKDCLEDEKERYEARLRFNGHTTSEQIFLLAQKQNKVDVGTCECCGD